MSGSRIIIADKDRLDNIHPGDILREDFLIGSDIPAAEVAAGTGIDETRLEAILAGEAPIDADVALRLSRYLGMSEGFFIGLQIDYDVEEVRRTNGAEIDQIARRAA